MERIKVSLLVKEDGTVEARAADGSLLASAADLWELGRILKTALCERYGVECAVRLVRSHRRAGGARRNP